MKDFCLAVCGLIVTFIVFVSVYVVTAYLIKGLI